MISWLARECRGAWQLPEMCGQDALPLSTQPEFREPLVGVQHAADPSRKREFYGFRVDSRGISPLKDMSSQPGLPRGLYALVSHTA